MTRRSLALLTAAVLALGTALPAYADPPPWAPAHGARAKGKGNGKGAGKDKTAAAPEAVYLSHFGINQGRCDRASVSRTLAEAGGQLVGNRVGGAEGPLVAAIAGALIGAAAAKALGEPLDRADRTCLNHVFEYGEIGRTVAWTNPDTGLRTEVTPTRTFQRDGLFCRDFTASLTLTGQASRPAGIACRTAEGQWTLRP